MTQNQSNTSYALLAVALAASLLYRPVIAADPDPSQATAAEPEAQALSTPVRQDFDALLSAIEARQPVRAPEDMAAAAAGTEAQLNAARIEIGILQQAVVAALAARAEVEAELEALWRDSRAEIDALKAAQGAVATGGGAVASDLAGAKGAAAAEVRAAAFRSSDEIAAADATDAAPAGPTELMLNEIHFNPGSAALTPGGERRTLEAADRIKALGAHNVRVAGHADTKGPAAHNLHLSLQRARSIAALLTSVGVSSALIEIEGNGETRLPEPTPDQVSEPLNRAVAIFAMVDPPADQAQP